MGRTHRRGLWFAGVATIALLAAACAGGADAGSGGSDSLSMRIGSPEEGARVSDPFTVRLDANVALDDPSTGEHHVHLCLDGADCNVETEYALVYGETFEVRGLSPGEHTIEASLRNADHSDSGVSDEITVMVGSGAGSDSGMESDEDGAGGFDY
jgi:hypothetical protein